MLRKGFLTPNNGNFLPITLITTGVGLFYSVDGSVTFQLYGNGSISYSSYPARGAISKDLKLGVFATTKDRYSKSFNNGTWINIAATGFTDDVCMSKDGKYILLLPKYSNNTYKAKLSTDGLQTAPVDVGSNLYYGNSCCMSSDGAYMYMGTRNGVWVSNNSGSTWEKKNTHTINFSIRCTPDGQHVVATTYDDEVIVSHDYGQTWAVVYTDPDGNRFTGVDISDDGQTIVASGTYRASTVYSTNGGTSFTEISPVIGFDEITIAGDGSYIFAMKKSAREFYYSTDLGANWTIKTAVELIGANYDLYHLDIL